MSQPVFSVIFGLDPEIHKFFVVGTGSPAFVEDDKIGYITQYDTVCRKRGVIQYAGDKPFFGYSYSDVLQGAWDTAFSC